MLHPYLCNTKEAASGGKTVDHNQLIHINKCTSLLSLFSLVYYNPNQRTAICDPASSKMVIQSCEQHMLYCPVMFCWPYKWIVLASL